MPFLQDHSFFFCLNVYFHLAFMVNDTALSMKTGIVLLCVMVSGINGIKFVNILSGNFIFVRKFHSWYGNFLTLYKQWKRNRLISAWYGVQNKFKKSKKSESEIRGRDYSPCELRWTGQPTCLPTLSEYFLCSRCVKLLPFFLIAVFHGKLTRLLTGTFAKSLTSCNFPSPSLCIFIVHHLGF